MRYIDQEQAMAIAAGIIAVLVDNQGWNPSDAEDFYTTEFLPTIRDHLTHNAKTDIHPYCSRCGLLECFEECDQD